MFDLRNKLSEDYAKKQIEAGELWTKEHNKHAQDYADNLASLQKLPSYSFKEQQALFRAQPLAAQSAPSMLATRAEIDQQMRNDTNNPQFAPRQGYYVQQLALKTEPAKEAMARISADAESKTTHHFGNVSTNVDYEAQARSALARDRKFESEMRNYDARIIKEQNPLKRQEIAATKDFEYNSYKQAQLEHIAGMTGDNSLLERAEKHAIAADAAALRIKEVEIRTAKMEGKEIDQQSLKDFEAATGKQVDLSKATQVFSDTKEVEAQKFEQEVASTNNIGKLKAYSENAQTRMAIQSSYEAEYDKVEKHYNEQISKNETKFTQDKKN